ncbi:peptidoglycan recognition protein family protein [Pseudoclavibacter alba]|uniref:N-acetylmuramoyl-L-alanine amidase n=1 Tax=Pseudoclavibacter albus TaxID=272241 RepID=A0ABT2HZ70_9MICO|nr:peptidoglycan recognition family protein [Pseudoclavibacter alba]MCT2043617.1 peptidoglycan recognition protein family protein [Pseudoclavibacter alba]
MGVPAIATRESSSNGMWSPREANVDTLLVHHAASGSLESMLGMIASGAREVSANFVVCDEQIVCVVWPERRAWTSGSPYDGGAGARWDHRSITVETINSATGDGSGWPISDASYRSLARLARWMDATYPSFHIDRDHIIGHRELWIRFGASYPTECPGGIDLDRVASLARGITTTPMEDDMTPEQDARLARIEAKLDKIMWTERNQSAAITATRGEVQQTRNLATEIKKLSAEEQAELLAALSAK